MQLNQTDVELMFFNATSIFAKNKKIVQYKMSFIITSTTKRIFINSDGHEGNCHI